MEEKEKNSDEELDESILRAEQHVRALCMNILGNYKVRSPRKNLFAEVGAVNKFQLRPSMVHRACAKANDAEGTKDTPPVSVSKKTPFSSTPMPCSSKTPFIPDTSGMVSPIPENSLRQEPIVKVERLSLARNATTNNSVILISSQSSLETESSPPPAVAGRSKKNLTFDKNKGTSFSPRPSVAETSKKNLTFDKNKGTPFSPPPPVAETSKKNLTFDKNKGTLFSPPPAAAETSKKNWMYDKNKGTSFAASRDMPLDQSKQSKLNGVLMRLWNKSAQVQTEAVNGSASFVSEKVDTSNETVPGQKDAVPEQLDTTSKTVQTSKVSLKRNIKRVQLSTAWPFSGRETAAQTGPSLGQDDLDAESTTTSTSGSSDASDILRATEGRVLTSLGDFWALADDGARKERRRTGPWRPPSGLSFDPFSNSLVPPVDSMEEEGPDETFLPKVAPKKKVFVNRRKKKQVAVPKGKVQSENVKERSRRRTRERGRKESDSDTGSGVSASEPESRKTAKNAKKKNSPAERAVSRSPVKKRANEDRQRNIFATDDEDNGPGKDASDSFPHLEGGQRRENTPKSSRRKKQLSEPATPQKGGKRDESQEKEKNKKSGASASESKLKENVNNKNASTKRTILRSPVKSRTNEDRQSDNFTTDENDSREESLPQIEDDQRREDTLRSSRRKKQPVEPATQKGKRDKSQEKEKNKKSDASASEPELKGNAKNKNASTKRTTLRSPVKGRQRDENDSRRPEASESLSQVEDGQTRREDTLRSTRRKKPLAEPATQKQRKMDELQEKESAVSGATSKGAKGLREDNVNTRKLLRTSVTRSMNKKLCDNLTIDENCKEATLEEDISDNRPIVEDDQRRTLRVSPRKSRTVVTENTTHFQEDLKGKNKSKKKGKRDDSQEKQKNTGKKSVTGVVASKGAKDNKVDNKNASTWSPPTFRSPIRQTHEDLPNTSMIDDNSYEGTASKDLLENVEDDHGRRNISKVSPKKKKNAETTIQSQTDRTENISHLEEDLQGRSKSTRRDKISVLQEKGNFKKSESKEAKRTKDSNVNNKKTVHKTSTKTSILRSPVEKRLNENRERDILDAVSADEMLEVESAVGEYQTDNNAQNATQNETVNTASDPQNVSAKKRSPKRKGKGSSAQKNAKSKKCNKVGEANDVFVAPKPKNSKQDLGGRGSTQRKKNTEVAVRLDFVDSSNIRTSTLANTTDAIGTVNDSGLRRSGRARRTPQREGAGFLMCTSKKMFDQYDSMLKCQPTLRFSQRGSTRKTSQSRRTKQVSFASSCSPIQEVPNEMAVENPVAESPARQSPLKRKSESKNRVQAGKINKRIDSKETSKKILGSLQKTVQEEALADVLNICSNNVIKTIKWRFPNPQYEKSMPGVSIAVAQGYDSGYIKIDAGGAKPKQSTSRQLNFCVLTGRGEVGVQDKVAILEQSDNFMVPPGGEYYIRNLDNDNDLTLYFTKFKIPNPVT